MIALGWQSARLETVRLLWIVFFSLTPVGALVVLQGLVDSMGSAAGSKVAVSLRPHLLVLERRAMLLLLMFALVFNYSYVIAEDKEGYYMTFSWVCALLYTLGCFDLLGAAVAFERARRDSSPGARALGRFCRLVAVGLLATAPLGVG